MTKGQRVCSFESGCAILKNLEELCPTIASAIADRNLGIATALHEYGVEAVVAIEIARNIHVLRKSPPLCDVC